jgi:hypothetical protein
MRLIVAATATLVGLTLVGCSASASTSNKQATDPAANYFSPAVQPSDSVLAPVATVLPQTHAPATSSSAKSSSAPPLPQIVSRPNPIQTPGATASTDVAAICAGPDRTHTHIPGEIQSLAYQEYGLQFPNRNPNYTLDWLIPIELGGANTLPNIWPAAITGVGYHQKQQLNARLRKLVCSGQMMLTTAQTGLTRDWYALYLSTSTTKD